MQGGDRLQVPGNSDELRRAREMSKQRKTDRNLAYSLNESLNESIKSFERIYKEASQEIRTDSRRNSGYFFEENAEPEIARFPNQRRLSSFSRLKETLGQSYKSYGGRFRNDSSTNTSIYNDKKNTSIGQHTPQPTAQSKRPTLKAVIGSFTTSKFVGMKQSSPSSAKSKIKQSANCNLSSTFLKHKDIKANQSFKVPEKSKIIGPGKDLINQYDELKEKLYDLEKMIDRVTFETHFTLPETINSTDKFRDDLKESLLQMQQMVRKRTAVIQFLVEKNGSTKPSTSTNL